MYYRNQTHSWQRKREAQNLADRTPKARGKSCLWARYAVDVHRARALSARKSYKKWYDEHMLRDTADWTVAVRTVQRFFPGTESWLLSCSDAEGYNTSDPTRWVVHGGGPFNMSDWYHDVVGGPMQFRPSTIKGMHRRGLDYIEARDYRVPAHLRASGTTTAWRSMLVQAIAAGWARYTGNDNNHWSASWNNGCR